MTRPWTHSEICEIAGLWVRRNHSDVRCFGFEVDLCDGFRADFAAISGETPRLIIVEAKASRDDFLKTFGHSVKAKNPAIWQPFVGGIHIVAAPDYMVSQPSELPDHWGILFFDAHNMRAWPAKQAQVFDALAADDLENATARIHRAKRTP